ncbi:MAG: hypothetical protein JOZ72_11410 [Alphaproteobacteria bacterium]|nr:hypothetical protein [Alphaproteobacteria bacterium]
MTSKAMVALGLILVTGGAARAQLDGPFQGLSRGQQRTAERFLATFDLNHDGKVTHDELNRTDGARFASVAHGAGTIGPGQFAQLDGQNVQQHMAQMFRRLDWNGDGRLSLDEYAGPQRVRFEMFDRDGRGSESCAPSPVQHASLEHASFRPRGSSGRARFCADNDLNKDGSVSHAEFDSAMAKHFAAATSNAKAMTQAQFAADLTARYRDGSARYFQRLDADHDGRLSLKEYAASDQKLFARLDRNRDGTVTRDELSARRSTSHKRG